MHLMELKTFTATDYAQIAAIYQSGIDTGTATFETRVPDWNTWQATHLEAGRIAAFENGQMLGWAALTAVSGRCVYAGVAEVSVYIHPQARGKGVGTLLLEHLVQESEKLGFWTLQSGIFEENAASIRLHEKCGFRIVGYRERIGQIGGVWKNNLILERRSKTVGHD